MKLRQYMIEYGISVTSYTTCSINTVSVIHPTPMIMSAPSDPNVGSCSTEPKSTSTVPEQRSFPVLPFVIKEEPSEYEAMSDITVETESFDGHMQCNRNGRTSTNASGNKNNNQQQQSLTPLPSNSMVAVSTKSLLLSTRAASDNEYLSAYLPPPSSNSSQSTPTTSTKSSTDRHKKTVSSEIIETSSKPTEQSNHANQLNKKDTTKEIKKNSKKNVKEKGPQKGDIAERVTRQNVKTGPDGKKSRESRTRGGSIAKKDYKSFYLLRACTPTDLRKKTKINDRGHVSIDLSNIRTSSAKASNTKHQRTFSPNTAIKKRKLNLRKRSSL